MNDLAMIDASLDNALPMQAIRDALDEHGAVRLSIHAAPATDSRRDTLMPREISDEGARTQVLVLDSTRHIDDSLRRCVELGNDDGLRLYAKLDAATVSALPVLEMAMGPDGVYAVVGADACDELARLDPFNDPFVRVWDLDDATIERLIEDEMKVRNDPTISAFDRMMRPSLRDLGISVIECSDRHAMPDVACMLLNEGAGFDYRSINDGWNRKQGRRQSGRRRR